MNQDFVVNSSIVIGDFNCKKILILMKEEMYILLFNLYSITHDIFSNHQVTQHHNNQIVMILIILVELFVIINEGFTIVMIKGTIFIVVSLKSNQRLILSAFQDFVLVYLFKRIVIFDFVITKQTLTLVFKFDFTITFVIMNIVDTNNKNSYVQIKL